MLFISEVYLHLLYDLTQIVIILSFSLLHTIHTHTHNTETQSPQMAAALLNKIHRSFTNLTSTSSMESIDREG